MANIGIIGNGNVDTALARWLERAGHEVRAAGGDKGTIREVASWGEVVHLAVPFGAIGHVMRDVIDAPARVLALQADCFLGAWKVGARRWAHERGESPRIIHELARFYG